jgi:hypothetical protein
MTGVAPGKIHRTVETECPSKDCVFWNVTPYSPIRALCPRIADERVTLISILKIGQEGVGWNNLARSRENIWTEES